MDKDRLKFGLRLFFRNKGAVIGLIIMTAWIIIAIFTKWIAPYDPYEKIGKAKREPAAEYIFGTDQIGRDVFSRTLYGARVSMVLGFISIGLSAVCGIVLGLIAGFYTGTFVDTFIMRCMDALLAFPGMLLAMVIIAALGTGIENVMIAVGISNIPQFARLTRASVLSTRQLDYVEAARTIGASDRRIIFRHIFPNIVSSLIVLATMEVGNAILVGAGLSFLGMGAQPPSCEWGLATSQGRDLLKKAWWIATFPGFAILTVVMSSNLIGDGLRVALDPRMKYE